MRIPLKAAIWALSAALSASPALMAQSSAKMPAKSAPAAAPAAAAAAAALPTEQEIATAKSQGMVWVNTSSKVYHKDGAYYGKTKHGKFMTEADATKAGFKAAKDHPASAKASKKH